MIDFLIQYAEAIGVMASVLVLISFVLNGEKRIRVANIFGAVLFVIYGLLIQAYSIWILNGILIVLQFYKVYKIKQHKQRARELPVAMFYNHNNAKIQKILREVNKK